MRRILIYIPWFKPAFRAGGPIRSIDMLTANYIGDAEFFIVCGNKDVDGTRIDGVVFDCWTKYNPNTQVWYHSGSFASLPLKNACKLINPSFIMLVGVFSWTYNLYPLLNLPKERLIWSVRGMLHPDAMNQKRFKKQIVLKLLSFCSFIKKITFHATDETEQGYVEKIFGSGVQVRKALNFPFVYKCADPVPKKSGTIHLLTVALISPMKNHLLILHSLMQCKGDVVYDIVGAVKDVAYWNDCKELIEKMPSNIKVKYHGEKHPQDLESFYTNTHLLVLPSKSENFAHAIAEALSVGRPVITSFNTPWNHLQENKAGINVAADTFELLMAIEFFISMTQQEYNDYCYGARSYFDKHIDLKKIRNQYDNLFTQ